jgi:hypothetical protein
VPVRSDEPAFAATFTLTELVPEPLPEAFPAESEIQLVLLAYAHEHPELAVTATDFELDKASNTSDPGEAEYVHAVPP